MHRQRRGIGAVLRIQRDAEAGADLHRACDRSRTAPQRREQLRGDGPASWRPAMSHSSTELVPAEPRDGVGGAHGVREPPGRMSAQAVAGGVAPGIVDALEAIGSSAISANRAIRVAEAHRLRQPVVQQLAVRQPGQRIVQRQAAGDGDRRAGAARSRPRPGPDRRASNGRADRARRGSSAAGRTGHRSGAGSRALAAPALSRRSVSTISA